MIPVDVNGDGIPDIMVPAQQMQQPGQMYPQQPGYAPQYGQPNQNAYGMNPYAAPPP